jgi:hypothetical protein
LRVKVRLVDKPAVGWNTVGSGWVRLDKFEGAKLKRGPNPDEGARAELGKRLGASQKKLREPRNPY